MIEYYQLGGQLFANVKGRDLGLRFIWYVSWMDGKVKLLMPLDRFPNVPDDVQ